MRKPEWLIWLDAIRRVYTCRALGHRVTLSWSEDTGADEWYCTRCWEWENEWDTGR